MPRLLGLGEIELEIGDGILYLRTIDTREQLVDANEIHLNKLSSETTHTCDVQEGFFQHPSSPIATLMIDSSESTLALGQGRSHSFSSRESALRVSSYALHLSTTIPNERD